MEKFTKVTGVAATMLHDNIDTDAIIPASWLRSLSTDLGKGLFGGRRYRPDGGEVADFVLNRPPFRDSKIIVAGANFGCGSSREGAVWALMRFGIRCVIAPSFSDIFHENSFKNGLLLISLPASEMSTLAELLAAANNPTLSVDLERCLIESPQGTSIPFLLPPARRAALLKGLDEIGATLRHVSEIESFQREDRAHRPWIYDRAKSS
jgi:3-isopropylmalate/(R)-2-methylmalate dehydratase small subunit